MTISATRVTLFQIKHFNRNCKPQLPTLDNDTSGRNEVMSGEVKLDFRSKLEIFARLTRFQFIPLIILPATVGTALAYSKSMVSLSYFALVLVGVILLHLGANSVDDAYDFQNHVDTNADKVFPKDFPGWKPLPRGLVSLRSAKRVSYSLLALSLAVGVYFWYAVGPWAFLLALAGSLLAIFYSAPPMKLDYRGLGLGEISIFLSFGPIPVLGAFYVQTGFLSFTAFLVSIPIGLMTVTILLDHDLIFNEVYSMSGKRSLATILGKKNALRCSLGLTIVSFVLVLVFVYDSILPFWSIFAPVLSSAVLLRKGSAYSKGNQSPPFYVPFTQNALLANWIFALVLALSMIA
jgi:1,4-dihydroxy-2-naphthoate polyprenyltransferase